MVQCFSSLFILNNNNYKTRQLFKIFIFDRKLCFNLNEIYFKCFDNKNVNFTKLASSLKIDQTILKFLHKPLHKALYTYIYIYV